MLRTAFVSALVCSSPCEAAIRYAVTEIPPVAGFSASSPTRLNDLGTVVGSSTGGPDTKGMIWDTASGSEIIDEISSTYSFVSDIRNDGSMSGMSNNRPFYRSPDGVVHFLSGVSVADKNGWALALGDAGTMAGYVELNNQTYAAVWDDFRARASIVDPTPGSMLSGGGSNGVFVGYTSGYFIRGLVWSDATGAIVLDSFGPYTSGTFTRNLSNARDVNQNGIVVGYASAEDGERAFWWTSSDGLQDMGDLAGGRVYSRARSINSLGQVVGFAESSDGLRAALWDNFREDVIDLNVLIHPKSGWTLQQAMDINERGQIIGIGINPEGRVSGFVLNPLSFVPEPAIWALQIVGFGIVGLVVRKKNRQPVQP